MLRYDIANEFLSGDLGGVPIAIRAVSGGGRGSKVHPSGAPGHIGIHAWNTQRRKSGAARGGPLPPGFYLVHRPAQHPRLGRAAYLEPTISALLFEDRSSPVGISVTARGGFFIHGRGRAGSDGCIVPMERFQFLMDTLERHAPVALRVTNPGVRTDRLGVDTRGIA